MPAERRDDFVSTMFELEDESCRRLLSVTRFGRVALDDGGGPVVLPVNALFADDRVVFRTAPGSALDQAAARHLLVAYEVDHADTDAESGWSVLVRGHAAPLSETAFLAALTDTEVRPWAPAGRDRWIEIRAEQITGRLIGRERSASDLGPFPYMPPG
jgi:nitroimidazol reductase NimA-like FMN-containing flavoprotein (pyridoxamine 5'-phosphate oxidase superfamily)